jgi:hypothetical protein
MNSNTNNITKGIYYKDIKMVSLNKDSKIIYISHQYLYIIK